MVVKVSSIAIAIDWRKVNRLFVWVSVLILDGITYCFFGN